MLSERNSSFLGLWKFSTQEAADVIEKRVESMAEWYGLILNVTGSVVEAGEIIFRLESDLVYLQRQLNSRRDLVFVENKYLDDIIVDTMRFQMREITPLDSV